MKWLINTFCVFIFLMPLKTMAGWQVVSPERIVPNEPIFQARTRQEPPCTAPYADAKSQTVNPPKSRPKSLYAISVSGSVKDNVERIMNRYHWRVVWQAPYDFNFDGRIRGANLPDVIEKLLKPFPLQAKLYMSNRVMVITKKSKVLKEE